MDLGSSMQETTSEVFLKTIQICVKLVIFGCTWSLFGAFWVLRLSIMRLETSSVDLWSILCEKEIPNGAIWGSVLDVFRFGVPFCDPGVQKEGLKVSKRLSWWYRENGDIPLCF